MSKLCIYDRPIRPGQIPGVTVVGGFAEQGDHGICVTTAAIETLPQFPVEVYHYNCTEGFRSCLQWCIENKVDVLNVSWNLGYPNNEIQSLLDRFIDQSGIVACAAGNDHGGRVWWPASGPRTIAVGAWDAEKQQVAAYSNVGPELDCLADGKVVRKDASGRALATYFGTSFAAPRIAKYAAVWKNYYPNGNWKDFKEFIKQNCKDLGLPGKDPASGWGLFVWPENWPPIKEGENMSLLDYDLTQKSYVAVQVLDDYVKGTPLEGLGQAFVKAEDRYSVNARYLLAHAIHESGWGKSYIAQNKKNLFGFQAYDDSPYESAKKFPNFEACVDYCAAYIKAHYLTPGGAYYVSPTLRGMNVHYATDPKWGEKIAAIMAEIPERPLRLQPEAETGGDTKMAKDYEKHWAEATIDKVKALGIMLGDPDGKFRPNDAVTRAEMAQGLLDLFNAVKKLYELS